MNSKSTSPVNPQPVETSESPLSRNPLNSPPSIATLQPLPAPPPTTGRCRAEAPPTTPNVASRSYQRYPSQRSVAVPRCALITCWRREL
ncbi:hypothetical protein Scep_013037 [Stephania cephalantha]|uniref:Uncharacterized protein n=1 Tax=Stephania cephalantha TaxID=152367 RepID=A0AAP0P850_9MAGN